MILKNTHFLYLLIALSLSLSIHPSYAQEKEEKPLWHGIERVMHYKPSGEDFVLVQGKRRFNRALYGTNTAFRVEAGDLPEFALYMPGMGGNLQFALIAGNQSKWLRDADNIETRYRPGAMLYKITDKLLGEGSIELTVLAQANAEGMVLYLKTKDVSSSTALLAVYGGASGQTFSRAGDIGADPESSFYLLPQHCLHNNFNVKSQAFSLTYPAKKGAQKRIIGAFSGIPDIKLLDASQLSQALNLWETNASEFPVLGARYSLSKSQEIYIAIQGADKSELMPERLPTVFKQAAQKRKALAERVKVNTPDPYINTLGAALAVAADAIWESPTFLHGAVAWRMRLNAWRGAYVADPLGWHDRARAHFNSYAQSQVLTPTEGKVVADTALHLARQQEKMGNALFSSGYISRNPQDNTKPHHYDMNLVFFDQLFSHFQYTGDLSIIKQLWPTIKRHLAWEKRNFDQDGDGLYDAYCAIWASDALQYSGGGVTHTSAYNFRANQIATKLASLIGEDPSSYATEAKKIKEALQSKLWIKDKGWYAEYQDLLGNKLLHESPGLWTIYHALDAQVSDAFQAYQSLRFVDRFIPHIPVQAKGLQENDYYTLATTNWQPYTWSINNVALAENLQTALAYWQGGRSDEAFKLWKSNLLESMYLGASPGNFQQLSFYDAQRGELYRDFADPIGVAARTLTEGLFGIRPDALTDTLTIKPGFPQAWEHASLVVPTINFAFKRDGLIDRYTIKPQFATAMNLCLELPAYQSKVKQVQVNGKVVAWKVKTDAVGQPKIQVAMPAAPAYTVNISWAGNTIEEPRYTAALTVNEKINLVLKGAKVEEVFDPQELLDESTAAKTSFLPKRTPADGTFFVKLRQDDFTWWYPVNIKVKEHIADGRKQAVSNSNGSWDMLNLQAYFNAAVSAIFKQQYLSPRPSSPTLQLPWQGIGNWCYPLVQPEIDDSGLQKLAKVRGQITLPNGIPFKLAASEQSNILFTSMWDNYPEFAQIALNGKAKQLHVMMAGTTNPMQSQLVNAKLMVTYTDGEVQELSLRNPDNWWPIEQDYLDDGFAFRLPKEKPYRIYLKTAKVVRGGEGKYQEIKGFTNRAIDGGAATALDFPLNPDKELKSLQIKTIANDVVVGLMAVTLLR